MRAVLRLSNPTCSFILSALGRKSRLGYDGPVSATARGGDADKGVSQAQRPAAPPWLGRLPCSGPPIGPARGAAADTATRSQWLAGCAGYLLRLLGFSDLTVEMTSERSNFL